MEKKTLEELKVMDCFSLLGVNEMATDEEIRKAHRKISTFYHPDTNTDPNALEKMQVINQAFEKIKTKEKREKYQHDLYRKEKAQYEQYLKNKQPHKPSSTSSQQIPLDKKNAITGFDQRDLEEESFNRFLNEQSTDFKRIYFAYYNDLMDIAKEVDSKDMDSKRIQQQTRKLALEYTKTRIETSKNENASKTI